MRVRYSSTTRRGEDADVAIAVKAALSDLGFPSGTGATAAQPIKQVTAARKQQANTSRRLSETGGNSAVFTITVTAFAPSLQAISRAVHKIDLNLPKNFRDLFNKALRTKGGTAVSSGNQVSNDAAECELLGSPRCDLTSEGLTGVKPCIDYQGKHISDDYCSEVLDGAEFTLDDRTYPILVDVAPTVGGGRVGEILVGGESKQSTNESGLDGGLIFLIVLLILCVLLPFLCYYYARVKYGAGKFRIWLDFTTSHSNPYLPFLYKPLEERERLRKLLFGETVGKDQLVDKEEEVI